jgi:hypothetical protein
MKTRTVRYRNRRIRYQPLEKVWVFNVNIDGEAERRVRNTLRAAKETIDQNYEEAANQAATREVLK